jgi:hypothetical protein
MVNASFQVLRFFAKPKPFLAASSSFGYPCWIAAELRQDSKGTIYQMVASARYAANLTKQFTTFW